jgi:hypothetical protein
MLLYPLAQARDALRFYRDFCPGLPDETETFAALLTSPDGEPVLALLAGYNGPLEDGERALAPLRRFGQPLADLVQPMPYCARQTLLDEPNAQHGPHRYWRSAFTEQISDELIDTLVEAAGRFSSPLSALIFFYVHGAATRVANSETAFAARQPQWDFDAIAQWTNPDESTTHIAWLKALWEELEPQLKGSAYVNHLASDDQPEKIRASYGNNYQRLRDLKTIYDPGNIFRLNAKHPARKGVGPS